MRRILIRWIFAGSIAVCLALGCAPQHVPQAAKPAASPALAPQTAPQPAPQPEPVVEQAPAPTPPSPALPAPPVEAASPQQQLAPAATPEPKLDAPAPTFKWRKYDDIRIKRGGLTIGLPEAARTSFDEETMGSWSAALFDAMDGCYEPAFERNPKLIGSMWSTLVLRARGRSAFSLQPTAGPLQGVASCLRKRLPKPPLVTIPGAEGTYSLRLRFEGPSPRDPRLR
jgi:hypothetical protein